LDRSFFSVGCDYNFASFLLLWLDCGSASSLYCGHIHEFFVHGYGFFYHSFGSFCRGSGSSDLGFGSSWHGRHVACLSWPLSSCFYCGFSLSSSLLCSGYDYAGPLFPDYGCDDCGFAACSAA